MTQNMHATSADNYTVRRTSHGLPGMGSVELIAQPTYTFTYWGQNYSANWDHRNDAWVVSWLRDTDGQLQVMTVRHDLDMAVRDAMDDVDALARHLPRTN